MPIFLFRFKNEIPLCADWGSHLSGGRIIVGGSKGTIVIVDVLLSNATMFISY